MDDSSARQILRDIKYATIATVTEDGKPWNTPVFCATDSHGNLYWSSHPDSVHSRNIARTSDVFIAIYNSKAGEGEGVGLYIEGSAHVVEAESEMLTALSLLGERRGRPFLHPEKFRAGGPQRIYKATPRTCWLNDADQDSDGDFIRDYRAEVHVGD